MRNYGRPLCFSTDLLGCSCCAKCKENRFQSTGARRTERETSQETAPARRAKMHPKSAMLAPRTVPKSPQNLSQKPKQTQRDTESRPGGGKSDQERPKSTPRTSKSDFKTILGPFPGSGGPWGGVAVGRRSLSWRIRPGKSQAQPFQTRSSHRKQWSAECAACATPPTTVNRLRNWRP